MASPQIQDGHVKIADGLFVAIMQTNLTGLERRVLDVIMLFTYRNSLTQAEIGVGDFQGQINGGIMPNRIEKALESLVDQNIVHRATGSNQHRDILGIQKNFDKWGPSHLESRQNVYTSSNNNIYNNTSWADKMSENQVLASFFLEKLGRKLSDKHFVTESNRAKRLLGLAATHSKDPAEAEFLCRQYFHHLYRENLWFRREVRFPLAYMLTGFSQWLKQMPAKPRQVKVDELAIGKRFCYNFKHKVWEKTNERIDPTQR